MNRRISALVIVIVPSILLGLYAQRELATQGTGVYFYVVGALGYGLTPWIVGLVVAALKLAYARIRKTDETYMQDLLWATGVMVVLLWVLALV